MPLVGRQYSGGGELGRWETISKVEVYQPARDRWTKEVDMWCYAAILPPVRSMERFMSSAARQYALVYRLQKWKNSTPDSPSTPQENSPHRGGKSNPCARTNPPSHLFPFPKPRLTSVTWGFLFHTSPCESKLALTQPAIIMIVFQMGLIICDQRLLLGTYTEIIQ